MFKTGYIINPRLDMVWFLGLPFVAVLAALGAQAWLPFVAVASINLWITIPHHYATWVRTYGMPEDWSRFKEQLVLGPIIIVAAAAAGMVWAPITLLIIVMAWDHQHSIMQQHGFSRIYDFKAGTGMSNTGRFDLTLHWILYSFMFLNAPMFRNLWIRELYKLEIPLSVQFVDILLLASRAVLAVFIPIYIWHLWKTLRNGESLNPIKYAFIGASYFLWYFAAWHTNSILLFAIAHRLMHGLQYIVMVYFFLQRKSDLGTFQPGFWSKVSGQGRLKWFLIGGGAYALVVQLLINRPLDEFGFGVVNFISYQAVPEFGLVGMDYISGYELFAQTMISAYALVHYYVDSFIWKVRDAKVQVGL